MVQREGGGAVLAAWSRWLGQVRFEGLVGGFGGSVLATLAGSCLAWSAEFCLLPQVKKAPRDVMARKAAAGFATQIVRNFWSSLVDVALGQLCPTAATGSLRHSGAPPCLPHPEQKT